MLLNPAGVPFFGFGAFLYVSICATPGIRSAVEVSMSLIRACGCGEVRNFTYSMSGNQILLAYCALPVNLGIETSGSAGIGFPKTLRFSGGYPCHFLVTVLRAPSSTSLPGRCPPVVE